MSDNEGITLEEFKIGTGYTLSEVFGTGTKMYQKVRAEMLKGRLSPELKKIVYQAIKETAKNRTEQAKKARKWRFPEDRKPN